MPHRLPARSALFLALALLALAVPLLAASPGLARPARATHARASKSKSKSRRHHAKRTHHAKKPKKHKGKHKPATGTTVAAPSAPAVCEDGSKPKSEGEGLYSCSNGAEPVCANGAEPTPAHGSAKLLCPAATSSNTEWSEAECEDGSAPERSTSGGFACEDGSTPSCEDGSRPTLSDDGSMLVCIAQGSPGSSSSPVEEVEEGEDEDDATPVRAHVAIAS